MKAKSTTGQGRPRKFDEGVAMEKAMEVFWRRGYDAASISELTAAMGINPPSLYAAFGNKEELFIRVLDHYGAGPAAYSAAAVQEATAYEVAKKRLYGAVEAMCDASRPPGCLAVQATARCGDPNSVIGQKLAAWLEMGHQRFVKRFKRAQAEGDLAKNVDPAALARLINAVAHGIAVTAVTGVSRAELEAIAEFALQQIFEKPPKIPGAS